MAEWKALGLTLGREATCRLNPSIKVCQPQIILLFGVVVAEKDGKQGIQGRAKMASLPKFIYPAICHYKADGHSVADQTQPLRFMQHWMTSHPRASPGSLFRRRHPSILIQIVGVQSCIIRHYLEYFMLERENSLLYPLTPQAHPGPQPSPTQRHGPNNRALGIIR